MGWKILTGDCLDVLRTMPDNSVDAVVTDPPYGLAFMGKRWDYDVPSVEAWAECLRVLKPGGHLLAFFGTRTYHRGVVRVEDAGFEIRDCIAWVYGQGFPKSLDVSKAIDKMHGAVREVVGVREYAGGHVQRSSAENLAPPIGTFERAQDDRRITAPATPEAARWSGWGTALKPAMEPIVVARKPLSGTVAENVLRWGTGAVNIDGCRIGTEMRVNPPARNKCGGNSLNMSVVGMPKDAKSLTTFGRWPANVVHDGSDEVVGLFPEAGGGFGTAGKPGQRVKQSKCGDGQFGFVSDGRAVGYGDSGSAARFFYCAKASKGEREAGLREVDAGGLKGRHDGSLGSVTRARNVHPTVKPVALMAYLCRLVTPPGGVVLDPFTGSGSTGVACVREGFDFIGIEREPEYVRIAEARIGAASGTLGAEVTR